MKPGFKPKLWTSKEWKDAAPSSKTNGCGVEAALDLWQKNCKKKFGDMTPEEAFKAWETAKKLSEVLTAASRKCDPKSDKDTLGAILEYKKRADDYTNFAKLAAAALTHRINYAKGLSDIDKVLADKEAFTLLEKYTKMPQVNDWAKVHTYLLCKAKQYEKAVTLYGRDNDYNIPGDKNKILYDTFVTKVRHDQKDVLAAIGSLESEVKTMLNTNGQIYDPKQGFKALPEWKAHLAKKFPCKEYAVS